MIPRNTNIKPTRKGLILIVILLLQSFLSAQDIIGYSVGEVKKVEYSIKARENGIRDDKNNLCALIIVNFKGVSKPAERDEFQFDGGAGSRPIIIRDNPGEIWLYFPKGTQYFNITHNGYGNQEVGFTTPLESGCTYTVTITVTKSKSPSENVDIINISTTPSDADVNVKIGNNEENESTPCSFKRVPIGSYKITITKDRYKTIDTTIYVDKDHHDFSFTMEKDYATVTLKAGEGTDIYVNNISYGSGSWSGELASGVYTIETRKDNHRTQRQNITVVAGKDMTIRLTEPEPIYGKLTVTSNVSGCKMEIDGAYYTTIKGNSQTFNNILIGEHDITLKAAAKTTETKSVEISEYQRKTLDFKLVSSWMEYDKLERNFLNLTYSTSGNFGIMAGAMYESRIGFYTEYQTSINGLRLYPEIKSNQRRFSAGMMVGLSDWWFLYFGPGIINDISDSASKFHGAAEAGFEFRAGGVSFLAGAEYNGFSGGSKGHFNFNFGLGFSLKNQNRYLDPFLSLVYSPSAPVGVMAMWRKNNISLYFKLQTALLKKNIKDGIKRERYSLTFGPTFSLTNWLTLYGGAGVGLFKGEDDSAFKFGGDLETGLSFHIGEAVSLTAGVHRANAFSEKAYTEFDVGIGLSTELMGEIFPGDDMTFIEYSGSFTAPYGLMSGVLEGNVGIYGRFQTSNPVKFGKAVSPKIWNGFRSSLTVGPIISFTQWLYLHGGIGVGAYKNFDTEQQSVGFEAEAGLNLRLGVFVLSAGPHFCKVGSKDYFLDWNLGLGAAINDVLLDLYDDHQILLKYVYTPGAPFGLEIGAIIDDSPFGLYIGNQFKLSLSQFYRYNFSAGVIIAPFSYMNFQYGLGFGVYLGKVGFDMETEVSINLGPVPVSIGIKMCRVGNSEFFLEPMMSVGILM